MESESQQPKQVYGNKRIVKNTAILYMRMLLGLVVSLFTTRIVIMSLGNIDYGLYNVVAGVIVLFTFINSSLSESTSRFLTYELGGGTSERQSLIFTQSMRIHAGLALAVLVVAETIGLWGINNILNIPSNRILACNIVFQFVILGAMQNVTQAPLHALIIAHERMGIYAYISLASIFIRCVIAGIVLVIHEDKLITYAILNYLADLGMYLFYWLYCRQQYPSVCTFSKVYDKKVTKEMLNFSGWDMLGSASWMLNVYGLNILMNIFFTPFVNTANAIATNVNTLVTGFSQNFMTAMNPQIVKSYAAGETERMKTLVFNGGKYSFFLLMLICYPLIFETKYLLDLWLEDVTDFTIIFIRLVLMTTMISVFEQPIRKAVEATGKIKWYQLSLCIFYLLAFPLSYLLYYIGMPPYSAYILYLFVAFVTIFVRLYFMSSILNLTIKEYFNTVLGRCALVGLLSLILPTVIFKHVDESLLRLFITGGVCTLSTTFFVMTLGMNSKERSLVKDTIVKRWLKQ